MTRSRKIVLVTGANSGLGKTIAQTLAASGYVVYAAMRHMSSRNAAAADELSTLPCIKAIELDVTRNESATNAVTSILGIEGRIDILINCAGIMWTGVSEAFSIAQFQAVLETNLVGPFRLMKAVLPTMRKQRSGLLINISSLAGRSVIPGLGLYCASKFGLEALTEAMGYELSDFGIEAVIIEPGPFATNLMNASKPPADQDVVEAYGASADFTDRMRMAILPVLTGASISTDPQLVADAVVKVISSPPGERPRRVTVGWDLGVAELNERIAEHQSRFLDIIGLQDLETVKWGAHEA